MIPVRKRYTDPSPTVQCCDGRSFPCGPRGSTRGGPRADTRRRTPPPQHCTCFLRGLVFRMAACSSLVTRRSYAAAESEVPRPFPPRVMPSSFTAAARLRSRLLSPLHTPAWRLDNGRCSKVAPPAGCMHMPPTVCPLLEPTDRHAGHSQRHKALLFMHSLCYARIPTYPTLLSRALVVSDVSPPAVSGPVPVERVVQCCEEVMGYQSPSVNTRRSSCPHLETGGPTTALHLLSYSIVVKCGSTHFSNLWTHQKLCSRRAR
jgi:hypothetical protein